MVPGEVSKFTGNADGLSVSVQDNTGLLHLAQNRESWKQFSICGKSPEKVVLGASGTHASGMTGDGCRCCLVDREKKRERKVWRALGTPLSVSSQLRHCLRCPHGTELVVAGRIRMALGMDVDQKWFFGDVVRKC